MKEVSVRLSVAVENGLTANRNALLHLSTQNLVKLKSSSALYIDNGKCLENVLGK